MFSNNSNNNIKIKNNGKYYAEISNFTIRNKLIDFETTIFDISDSLCIKFNDMIVFTKHKMKDDVGYVTFVNSFYCFDDNLHIFIRGIKEATIYNLMNKKIEDFIKNKIILKCTADIEINEYLFQKIIIYI